MAIDPYQPCPCGIDKKIKFCCGSEVLGDLEKVEDALSGDQRLGALDLINRLLAAKNDRPCLHMYKAMVQLSLKELPAARQAVEEMLRIAPGNPAGMAMAAMLDCYEENIEDAVEKLQMALEAQQGKLANSVYEALGIVGRSLAIAGEPIAAQAHLVLQTSASRGQDQTAVMALLELERSGEIPLAVQGALILSRPDAAGALSAAETAEFNAALQQADMGCWLAAARRFEALAGKNPKEPAVWHNVGILRARLMNNGVAVDALRRYTSFASVPRDLAVEAEALAQYLAESLTEADFVWQVSAIYPVTDTAALKEHLFSSRRLQNMPFDPAQFQEANQVAPQAAFLVLDREVPSTSSGISRDTVPKIIGEALLFGKQTDREARIEFIALKTADYETRLKSFVELLGSFAGPKLAEEKAGRVPAVEAALTINWRFPDDTPPDVRKRLAQEQRALTLLSIWPNLPMGALDGKTPRQTVADPAGQLRVQAIILLMELSEPDENADYNKLRRSLGLPTLEPIEPDGVRVQSLTPAQQVRLNLEKVSDDDLVDLYRRGGVTGAAKLVRKLTKEVVARPSLDSRNEISKAEAYDLLARTATDSNDALAMLLKAQEAAKARNESPARYLLQEFPLRLQRMEEAEARRVLSTLTSRHMREPGIAQALSSLLAQLGLLQVDPATGRPVVGGPAAGGGMPSAAPAAAAAPAGIWTPDQGMPAAPAASGGKSKLWIPGMD